MVRDAELFFDDGGHSRARPQFSAKPVCFGPVREAVGQPFDLSAVEAARSASVRSRPERLASMLAQSSYPLADRRFRDVQSFCNLFVAPALLLEFDGLQTAPLFPVFDLGFITSHALHDDALCRVK